MGVGVALFVLAAAILPVSVNAQTNAFSVLSFEGDYYLSRTNDKRSQMRITEKITVQFPPYDQNHGIERAIPEEYDGHKVKLTVSSVKDEKGKNVPYRVYDYNKNRVVRIGDPNKYVHGNHTYILNYQVSDVTKNFADKSDELFWDTNGTDWGQTFGSVTARLHMGNDLDKAFDGKVNCFEGSHGSTSSCKAEVVRNKNQTTVTFKSSRMLYAGENVSFVAGFKPKTFAPYEPTLWERVWPVVFKLWLWTGLAALVYAAFRMRQAWVQYGRSPEGNGTIIPEYLPPKDLTVLRAAAILKRKATDETAQIIDLAVRHYLKIYETETKGSWFRKKKSYELELVKKPQRLKPEEKELLAIIFGDTAEVGQRVTIEALSSKLYKDAEKIQKQVEAVMRKDGYIADMAAVRKRHYWVGGGVTAVGALSLNPGVLLAGLIVLIVAANFHPLTKKGVIARDYLRGLEMYMKLAEAERMKVLQSPKGAAKAVDPKNKRKLIKLYEQLLPYAIVFGLEKEWAKEFAALQPNKAPDWYAGNWAGFNAAVFASSLAGFTSASTNSFTPPSSSSSSGFSSGGGFSGGGGGGGGGGGW